tara:strand:- start:8651 stop:9499 length:849 start_codon:yes stop_codon:yes gene_type:complete
MNIPASLLKKANFSKINYKKQNITVFQNKIVNKDRMPMLYNIELGIRLLNDVVGGENVMKTNHTKGGNRHDLARDLLERVGVSYVNMPNARNYSLLQANSNKPELINTSILDATDFANTHNEKSSLTKSGFKAALGAQTQDPIFNLDEGRNSNREYVKHIDPEGRVYQQPDLSRIASTLVRFNLSKNYPKRTKYFMPVENLSATTTAAFPPSPARRGSFPDFSYNPMISISPRGLGYNTTSARTGPIRLGARDRALSPRRQGLMSSTVPGGPDWDLFPGKGY